MAPANCDLIVSGGLVMTLDAAEAGRSFSDGAVAIRDRLVVDVGPRERVTRDWVAARTLDARDRIVIPGLINIHNHTPLVVARGMIEDIGFAPAYTPGVPQGHKISAEESHLLSRLGMYELLRAGCTTVVDYYRYPEGCAAAAAELGLRAVIGGRVHDADPDALSQGRYEHRTEIGVATLAENAELIARWDGHDGGRIRCDWAPHAPDTCSRALFAEVAGLASRHGGAIHSHLAQSERESQIVEARDGLTSAQLFDVTGMLDRRLIAAHCIWLNADDVDRVGRAGVTVAHSPIGNAKSGTIAPIMALRAAGAQVALCTDAFTGDLFEAMRWAIAMQRVRERGFVLSAGDVIAWATRAPAAALGMADRIGSIEIGKRADLTLIDATSPRLAPLIDGAGVLVHSASGSDVRSVIVDGRVLLEDGVLLTADGPDLIRQAQRVAARLWADVGRPSIAV